MDPSRLFTLTEALIVKTDNGRVSTWVDNIGTIAKQAGLPIHQISWSGSPEDVATKVVTTASRFQSS